MPRPPLTDAELEQRRANPYTGQMRKSRAKSPAELGIVAGRPPMPESIKEDPDAAAEWKRMCRLLQQRGTLSRADGPFLELYCTTHSEWMAARRELKAKGLFVDVPVTDSSGEVHFVRKENPARKVISQCVTAMRQFLIQFGATPASREKAKPTKEPTPKDEPLPPDSIGAILAESQRLREERENEATDGQDGEDLL